MIGRLAASLAGLLLISTPALAQQAVDASGPIELHRVDPEANLVEALVVNARLPGPAWWKVSDADTVIYVLGVPALTPSKLDVDSSVLKRRLDGANVLIMGQEADVSLVRIVALALGGKRYFISSTPMRQTLPPELRARLEARLLASKQKLDSLDEVKPAFAGFVVANSQDGNLSISVGGVTDTIREIARSKDIADRPRIQTLPGYSLVEAVKTLGTAPQPLQELCLDAGLRQAESGEGGIKLLSERWARGEVRAVVLADRGFSRCLASTPSIARELRSGRDDAVVAIAAALGKPGKAVAVIELRSLLAQDGVLDQLRGRGFVVTTPGE
ncbi:TraB/GumN family protein [Caulobacter sp. DWP3-1-3b2]|uniref:TraB/GumN family protein n=1 Tax=Caulobacter sp. DWP3-1-3b2 TaxID=2804643 RepID=UPI003CF2EFFB